MGPWLPGPEAEGHGLLFCPGSQAWPAEERAPWEIAPTKPALASGIASIVSLWSIVEVHKAGQQQSG